MRYLTGIITYNRISYLKRLLATWDETRDRNNNRCLVIADDGSTDGTIDYINSLKFDGVSIEVIHNRRCGVHHQVNTVLKYASNNPFDVGFMIEDDVYFLKNGWDNLYVEAIKLSNYDHLSFFDNQICFNLSGGQPTHARHQNVYIPTQKIQSKINNQVNAFGCFWTFTSRVIEKVGYFDLLNLGLTGSGHTDYSNRCCKAGFNKNDPFFDAIDSQEYNSMVCDNYRPSCNREENNFISAYNVSHSDHKWKTIADINRVYVPYNELSYDMSGKEKSPIPKNRSE